MTTNDHHHRRRRWMTRHSNLKINATKNDMRKNNHFSYLMVSGTKKKRYKMHVHYFIAETVNWASLCLFAHFLIPHGLYAHCIFRMLIKCNSIFIAHFFSLIRSSLWWSNNIHSEWEKRNIYSMRRRKRKNILMFTLNIAFTRPNWKKRKKSWEFKINNHENWTFFD